MSNRTPRAEDQQSSQDHANGAEDTTLDSHENAPLLGRASSLHHSRTPHLHSSHVHFNGDDPATIRAKRRRRVFLFLAGVAVFTVLGVIVIVAIVYGYRIRRWRSRDDTPDYSILPPPQPGLRNPSYLVRGTHGAVATEAETCSQIGLDILKDGGKATDAAIGSALCGEIAILFLFFFPNPCMSDNYPCTSFAIQSEWSICSPRVSEEEVSSSFALPTALKIPHPFLSTSARLRHRARMQICMLDFQHLHPR